MLYSYIKAFDEALKHLDNSQKTVVLDKLKTHLKNVKSKNIIELDKESPHIFDIAKKHIDDL